MDMKISQDVLEAYFHCKYKSHLKYTGQQGLRSEYESLFAELRERVRLQAIEQESCKNSGNDEIRDTPLTSLTLKKGSALIVSPHVKEGPFSWTLDAIKRLLGESNTNCLSEKSGARKSLDVGPLPIGLNSRSAPRQVLCGRIILVRCRKTTARGLGRFPRFR